MPWKMNFQFGLLPFLTLIWKKGTVLILGDSAVSGLRESKMPFRKNTKVRFFTGARIQDMYNYLVPLKDAPHITADEMQEELGKLKSLIWEMLLSVKLILSAPTMRVDKHCK